MAKKSLAHHNWYPTLCSLVLATGLWAGGCNKPLSSETTNESPIECISDCSRCGIDNGCGEICDCLSDQLCSAEGICTEPEVCTQTCASENYECASICGEECGTCSGEQTCQIGRCVAPFCGDNVVNNEELCDGNCPSSCDDINACTTDVLNGSPATCDAQCVYTAIETCAPADGCCPTNCDFTSDSDCPEPCTETCADKGWVCGAVCGEECGLCESDATCVSGSCETDGIGTSCENCSLQLKVVSKTLSGGLLSNLKLGIDYLPTANEPRPRIVDLYLTPDATTSIQSLTIGQALLDAGKSISQDPETGELWVVQPDASLRFLILSAGNTNLIDEGRLMELDFEISPPQPGPLFFNLIKREFTFAPPDADAALMSTDYDQVIIVLSHGN